MDFDGRKDKTPTHTHIQVQQRFTPLIKSDTKNGYVLLFVILRKEHNRANVFFLFHEDR